MTSTTPLLLLLDSVLSQDPIRIQEARQRIRQVVAQVNPEAAARPAQRGANFLLHEVDMLLRAFPSLASIASTHDGSLPLHFAASIGNVAVATRILNRFPAAASTPNSKGKIPLHYAAREGRFDMVSYFLMATPHTADIQSKKQKLALHFAAGDGHTDVVRQLLRVNPRGASLPSAKGKLPLHFAARWGHMQIAWDLIHLYPEGVRCVDWDGSLPLHDAAREGQVVMSKFLIERYPVALSIANIRGEIPLFPAVRNGNVDLVILYLQGWPLGGMHILKSISADDNIQDWDWKIVELCLRGAVENFSDCSLLEGKEPPAVCCSVDGEDFISSMTGKKYKETRVMEACCARWQQMDSTFMPETSSDKITNYAALGSITGWSRSHSAAPRASAFARFDGAMEEPVPRSKSPILEEGGRRSKKRLSNGEGNDRKRRRSGTADDSPTPSMERQPKFVALHAALACGASSHVIRCVLDVHPGQVSEVDEKGRFPLHLAVRHPTCRTSRQNVSVDDTIERPADEKPMLKIVIEDILKPHPEAAFAADCHGDLPLHLAIRAKSDFSIIHALIQANPSSGVAPVESADRRFAGRPPIYMATECDCDLSTTYLLLRGDPSVVSVIAKV